MTQNQLNTIIGKNIKKYRLKYKISQYNFANLIGISKKELYCIENNINDMEITINLLYKISKILNISINEFMVNKNE